MTKGRFITFEGGEGTGKSTQIKLLSEFLTSCGIKNIASKDPGGTEVGQELRRILVTGDKDKIDPITEALLYFADRRINLVQKVWPALEEGTWVMNDRFSDSTIAYQYYGYNKKIPLEILNELYAMSVGNFKPDLTIILDLDPKIGLARSMEKAGHMVVKETRHESRGIEFHNRLRQGYLELAAKEPDRIVVLNADKSIAELQQDIIDVVTERFELNICRK